jgi:tetratricopeptide (TPR) repeat protein
MLVERDPEAAQGVADPLPDQTALQALVRLHEHGLFLQAHALLRRYAPPERWRSPELVIRAARVLDLVGAERRALRLVARLHRARPCDPFARLAFAAELLKHRGPLFAWQYLRDWPTEAGAASWLPGVRALLEARTLALLGDFDRALGAIERARDLGCEAADAACEHAAWLDLQDRHDDALQLAAQTCRDHPLRHHPARVYAMLLHASKGSREALDWLSAQETRFESAELTLHRAAIEVDLGEHAAARRSLQRAHALLPEADPVWRMRLVPLLECCAYHLGDLVGATRLARQSASPALARIADRIEAGEGTDRRVLLDVRRVRQHRFTCAPATLTALVQWFGRSADHLQIAQAICYDGTRPHVERRWAQEHGWAVRELTLTWDAAKALIDEGIPFALMTFDPLGGHMMAVVGYDHRRGTLLIVDPSRPTRVEVVAESLLDMQAPYGPRAMVIVPPDKASAIERIELTDAPLYDQLHEVNIALETHRRQDAEQVLGRMRAEHAGHRIVAWAERSLALYDGNLYDAIRISERLLDLDGRDTHSAVIVNACLRRVATRAERVERLERSRVAAKAHPVVTEQLVMELADDARDHVRASRLARRLVRTVPERGAALGLLATVAWQAVRFDEARELMRFAACLEPLDEARARAYFSASQALGKADEALEFLRARQARLRLLSSAPTMTLFDALESMNRVDEAFDVLDDALGARPDDGELMIFAGVAHARQGRFEDAVRWIERARGKCAASAWHRAGATVAETRGELVDAAHTWVALSSSEPFAEDVQQAAARLLGLTQGAQAARDHARRVCERYPHQQMLARIWVDTLDGADPASIDEALGRAIAVDPKASWALRERALLRARMARTDAAREDAATVMAIEPANPASHHIAGLVERRAGNLEAARVAFEHAFALQADAPPTIVMLLEMANSSDELWAESERVASDLVARSVDGTGFEAWYASVADAFPPKKLTEVVDRILDKRPELWQAWSIAVRHACRRGKPKRACKLARQARERFPGNTTLLLDEAQAWRLRGDADEELCLLRLAHAMAPEPRHVYWLAGALQRAGRIDEAWQVAERALQRAPMAPAVLAACAEVEWRRGGHDRAITLLHRAAVLDPRSEDLWITLHEWRRRRGEETGALDAVRAVVDDQPWNASVRLVLARIQAALGKYEEALASARRAAQLDSTLVDALDLEAELLATLGRHEEALQVCETSSIPARSAVALRGRAIWVDADRTGAAVAAWKMGELLDQWPAYPWGVRQQVRWYDQAGDGDGMQRAAEHWVEVSPLDPEARLMLGKVLLAIGRVKDARAALARAASLAPDLVPALANSVDAALQDNDPAGAAKWADRIALHDELLASYWRVRIAAHRGDDDTMRELVSRLLSEPLLHPDLVHDVVRRAWKRWRPEAVDEVVLGCEATPEAVVAWATHRCAADLPPPWPALKRLRRKDEGMYRHAVSTVIEGLARGGHSWRALWYAARSWPVPRVHAESWGTVSFALLASPLCALIPWWMASGPSSEVRPWMLVNLALAWRILFQSRRAANVHARALLLPPDHSTVRHHLHLAFELAAGGDVETARRHLAEAGRPCNDFDGSVRAMVDAMLDAQTGDPRRLLESWGRTCEVQVQVHASLVLSWMVWRARWLVARRARRPTLLVRVVADLPSIGWQAFRHGAYRVFAVTLAILAVWFSMHGC